MFDQNFKGKTLPKSDGSEKLKNERIENEEKKCDEQKNAVHLFRYGLLIQFD